MDCHTVFVALADLSSETLGSETLVQFYSQLFSQKPISYIPNVYAEFRLPGLKLGIFKPKQNHQTEFIGQPGSMSLCLGVEQLEAAITRLTSLGCPPPGEIAIASHGREIYAYDPAGNRLILHEVSKKF